MADGLHGPIVAQISQGQAIKAYLTVIISRQKDAAEHDRSRIAHLPARSIRANRIDYHDAPVNPGCRQQMYCFAMPPASMCLLSAADITDRLRASLFYTLHQVGVALFALRSGGVCSKTTLIDKMVQQMPRPKLMRHLHALDRLDILDVAPATVSFHDYETANPTMAEAHARYQARLTQMRSAQRRFRTRRRIARVKSRRTITSQLHKLSKSVITQKTSQQARWPSRTYRSFSGHVRRIVPDHIVQSAADAVELELFGPAEVAPRVLYGMPSRIQEIL